MLVLEPLALQEQGHMQGTLITLNRRGPPHEFDENEASDVRSSTPTLAPRSPSFVMRSTMSPYNLKEATEDDKMSVLESCALGYRRYPKMTKETFRFHFQTFIPF